MSGWTVRPETVADAADIASITTLAFAGARHSDGGEAAVVARLRAAGDLAVSLVADATGVIGHVAFSAVEISDGTAGWFGLGPVSVLPEQQGRGIGAQLIRTGLGLLAGHGARGCVVLGDPAYYGRFGFVHDPSLAYPGPPAEYFQRLVLAGAAPTGVVRYAPAFS